MGWVEPGRMAVNADEAGRLVGKCDRTIRREIQAGRLRAAKHGRDWMILVRDLEEWAATGRNRE